MTLLDLSLPDRDQPLELVWPSSAGIVGILRFETPVQWRDFIGALHVHPALPQIITAKFARAQNLYLLGWIDPGLIKTGELAALIALELALTDRYGGFYPGKKPGFAKLLRHLVKDDGLTDAAIPMVAKYGGTAIGQLIGDVRPTLAERRNSLAHGDPFEGWPTSGLLELARDLIDYAYRGYLGEYVGHGQAS